MLVGLALIEFKTQRSFAVEIQRAKPGVGDWCMFGYRRATSPRACSNREHRGARQS